MEKAAKESRDDQPVKKPVAVRSAKDAINAMYADKEKSGLGDYLAMSAREIVNATDSKKGAEAKSAANLHKHANNHRMESVRTSASALMKMASSRTKTPTNRLQATDPIAHKANSQDVAVNVGPAEVENKAPTVVRTSLRLKPKKPTVKLPIESKKRPSSGTRLPKQPISLNKVHTHNPGVFQDVVRVGGAKPQPKPVAKKPSSEAPTKDAEIRLKKTVASQQNDVEKPVLKVGTGSTHKAKPNPIDSIKKKFAPAPKGFAASSARAARPDRPYQVEDYLNPSHATKSVPATDDATHYYGLSEEELAGNSKGVQVNRDQMAAEAGLGMIEDYSSGEETTEDKQATVLRRDSPDNNKYALSAQSPYYLKPEKEMKKRPLSGNGAVRVQTETATSVQAAQDLEEELPKKNQYKKNSKKSKKTKEVKEKKSTKSVRTHDINQPTMIIPAHHRSNAPLVALLLLTVILGATVGALAYLFFFQ